MKLFSIRSIHSTLFSVLVLSAGFASAQNKQARVDTIRVKPTKDVEISIEVPAQKGNTIYIVNSSRNLDIKTWAENKVKIVSTVAVEEDAKVGTGTEMFEKAGITLRSTSSRVELNSRGVSSGSSYTNVVGEAMIYNYGSGPVSLSPTRYFHGTNVVGYKMKRRTITIFVPAETKLDIDSRSSDIILREDHKLVKLNISNSNLDAQNVDDLSLQAKYSVVNLGDLKDAQVEFENGTFRAINIKNLDIDSKSSTIEYENGDHVYLRSQRDNYNIESVKKIEGRKQFGELRIDKLYTLLDIEGNNADVKIRNIMEDVETIKLSNSYADVRLPLRHLQNYAVTFEGNYSTVFAPFEKNIIKEEKTIDKDKKKEEGKNAKSNAGEVVIVDGKEMLEPTKITGYTDLDHGSKVVLKEAMANTYKVATVPSNGFFLQSNGPISPSKFTASVGDEKGKKTRFQLVCHSCTIDFK